MLLGVGVTALPFMLAMPFGLAALLVAVGWIFTLSGLGIAQVVLLHHCSHGTVFAQGITNMEFGRKLSTLLFFNWFDDYKQSHMVHHSAKKLLTEDDEFLHFVFNTLKLRPGVTRTQAWLFLILTSMSPRFHWSFLRKRLTSTFTGPQRDLAICVYASLFGLAAITGTLGVLMLAWILPLTILLQIATVYRLIVEHRFPEPEQMEPRDRIFVLNATYGVFPGRMPPKGGIVAWSLWWAEMLTWHLFVRLVVLVGDAPCHDYHHRRPASRTWTNYIHARAADRDTSFNTTWGLMKAVDATLVSICKLPAR